MADCAAAAVPLSSPAPLAHRCAAADPADRRFQPFMGIGDDPLDAAQPAPRPALQKRRPEGFGLRRADMQPNDLASAVGVGGHGDYCRDRDDTAALALL